MFALPGLPTLAEKSQSDHAYHKATDWPDFILRNGPEQ
jgi:hypothetical protein